MKTNITIYSEDLTKEDIQSMLQGIRDCELKCFPEKEIQIWIEVPELTSEECAEILSSIKPAYKYGPIQFSRGR